MAFTDQNARFYRTMSGACGTEVESVSVSGQVGAQDLRMWNIRTWLVSQIQSTQRGELLA